jgi:hypothetical protein
MRKMRFVRLQRASGGDWDWDWDWERERDADGGDDGVVASGTACDAVVREERGSGEVGVVVVVMEEQRAWYACACACLGEVSEVSVVVVVVEEEVVSASLFSEQRERGCSAVPS